LLVVLAPGCSKRRTEVSGGILSGKVTYNNLPVTGGKISFYGKEEKTLFVNISTDGTYLIMGLPPGDMVVTIDTEDLNPQGKTKKEKNKNKSPNSTLEKGIPSPDFIKKKMGYAAPPAADTPPPAAYVKLPSKYASRTTSPLVVTIVEGKQNKDWPLTD